MKRKKLTQRDPLFASQQVDTSPAALAVAKSRYLPRVMFMPSPPGARSTLGQSRKASNNMAATVVIWRCMTNVWKQYRLPGLAESVAAEGKKVEGEGGGEVAEEGGKKRARIDEASLKLVGRWIMSSNITTVAKSDVLGLDKLCFGLEDGAVVVWDNKTNTPVAGCSR